MTKIKCSNCQGEIENNFLGAHYFWSDCVNQLQSTITAQEDIINRLKGDAERLAKTLDRNGYCCEPHNRWLELQEDEDSHTDDCPTTLHIQLMNELGEK